MSVILYSYYRSSAAYRVRIALNLKNIDYQIKPVHLLNKGGEHRHSDYLQVNPQGLVPTLVIDNHPIIQSPAIIEYIQEAYPEPAILPGDLYDRANVRSMAQLIACDIHPLNNLRVLNFLKSDGKYADFIQFWYQHWVEEGFNAFEKLLRRFGSNGNFCYGDQPGLADIFLIPQVYNAKRFNCPLDAFPLIAQITNNCMALPAFIKAAPESQPDASDKGPGRN